MHRAQKLVLFGILAVGASAASFSGEDAMKDAQTLADAASVTLDKILSYLISQINLHP